MKILALDLSTKSGWSLLEWPRLIEYGKIVSKPVGDETSDEYPRNYITSADATSKAVYELCLKHQPDVVVIEETNKGKNRYSQKMLEFIHYAVNSRIWNHWKVKYIDTSLWRKLTDASYSKEDRAYNNEVNQAKHLSRDSLKKELEDFFAETIEKDLETIEKKSQRKRYLKASRLLIKDMVDEQFARKRVRIDGKCVSKVSKKDVAVRVVNSIFNTEFERKDNDVCDSILVGVGYYINVTGKNWRS